MNDLKRTESDGLLIKSNKEDFPVDRRRLAYQARNHETLSRKIQLDFISILFHSNPIIKNLFICAIQLRQFDAFFNTNL